MTFTEYCISQNIKLQPQDVKHIKTCLKSIPKTHHKDVVRQYCEIWVEVRGSTESPIEARKTNRGRYKANTWLREIASGEQALDAQV